MTQDLIEWFFRTSDAKIFHPVRYENGDDGSVAIFDRNEWRAFTEKKKASPTKLEWIIEEDEPEEATAMWDKKIPKKNQGCRFDY